MKKSRRVYISFSVFWALIFLTIILYCSAYNVKINNLNISHIADSANYHNRDIELYDYVFIGRYMYILINSDHDKLGLMKLEKGLNGNYKLNTISMYSGNTVDIEEINNNNQKGYLLFGHNNNNLYNDISLKFNNNSNLTFNNNKKYLLYYFQVPEEDKNQLLEDIKIGGPNGEIVDSRGSSVTTIGYENKKVIGYKLMLAIDLIFFVLILFSISKKKDTEFNSV